MRYILAVASLLILFSGCSQKKILQEASAQHSVHYLTSFDTLEPDAIQAPDINSSAFEHEYFAPWHYRLAPQTLSDIMWPYRSYTKGITYGATLQILDSSYFDRLKTESNFAAFDSIRASALSLQFSHLRNFPTQYPVFRDPRRAGEGFPFDYNQNSGVHANEPLYISHYSQSRAWVYVFTAYASGWLPSRSVALISAQHKRLWEHAKQVRILKDAIALHDKMSDFVIKGRIGMLLPLVKEETSSYTLLAAVAGENNYASFAKVIINKSDATTQPLLFDTVTLSTIGNQLINQNYGWGGLYEDRDCSSMLRDYFSVFGIWLPRNSFQQSHVGKVISIKDMNTTQKIQMITKKAIPFQTLLYKPGHIMLYLGVYDGKILIFHDTWGIKTLSDGVEGRYIIGKSIISTLNLGSKLADYDPSNNLLKKLESFNIVSVTP